MKIASVVFELLLRHVCDTPSYYVLSFCKVIFKFASVLFELLMRHYFDLRPDCDLDLGRRNLNHVCDTPSHYALSFCEVFIKCASVVY